MSRMDRYKILPALSEDSPQHGLMLAAYRDVGNGQRPACKAVEGLARLRVSTWEMAISKTNCTLVEMRGSPG